MANTSVVNVSTVIGTKSPRQCPKKEEDENNSLHSERVPATSLDSLVSSKELHG